MTPLLIFESLSMSGVDSRCDVFFLIVSPIIDWPHLKKISLTVTE